VQTRASERPFLGAVEDAHDERRSGVEDGAEAAQELDLRLQRLRLLVRPVHERPQVLEA
jgi:hypothetical protein